MNRPGFESGGAAEWSYPMGDGAKYKPPCLPKTPFDPTAETNCAEADSAEVPWIEN